MKVMILLAVLCLAALSCEAATTARPKATASKCGAGCSDNWEPVCGRTEAVPTGVTFGSKCVLDKVSCESGKSITKLNDGACANKNAPVRLS